MAVLSARRINRAFSDGDVAETAHARGQALENLLIYIFSKMPGVRFLRKDIKVAQGSEEIDLVFWNDRLPRGLPFLPNVLLFECKNWAAPVDSVSVSHFITKVRTRHVGYGFLIASNGVTGNAAELTAAHQQIQNALITDDIKIIVFDRIEVRALRNTKHLIELTQDKIAEVILRAI